MPFLSRQNVFGLTLDALQLLDNLQGNLINFGVVLSELVQQRHLFIVEFSVPVFFFVYAWHHVDLLRVELTLSVLLLALLPELRLKQRLVLAEERDRLFATFQLLTGNLILVLVLVSLENTSQMGYLPVTLRKDFLDFFIEHHAFA